VTPASPSIRLPVPRKKGGGCFGGEFCTFVCETRGLSCFDDLDGEGFEFALEIEDVSFFGREGRFCGGRESGEAEGMGERGLDDGDGQLPQPVE
jgi:hypothetical protein